MKPTRAVLRAALLGWVVITNPVAALAAPGSPVSAPASAPAGEPAARLLARIEQQIGEPRCTADTQCRSLPLGQRPCGGPEAYRAHALQGEALERLNALAAEHAALRRASHLQNQRVGICQLLPNPGARCAASGVCMLR